MAKEYSPEDMVYIRKSGLDADAGPVAHRAFKSIYEPKGFKIIDVKDVVTPQDLAAKNAAKDEIVSPEPVQTSGTGGAVDTNQSRSGGK